MSENNTFIIGKIKDETENDLIFEVTEATKYTDKGIIHVPKSAIINRTKHENLDKLEVLNWFLQKKLPKIEGELDNEEIVIVKHEDWLKIGLKYYKNKRDFQFKCVNCGNIQSINSVKAENPELNAKEIGTWIYFSCQGRLTKKGCTWSLGGLIQSHKLEVLLSETDKFQSFEYANEDANKELKKLKI